MEPTSANMARIVEAEVFHLPYALPGYVLSYGKITGAPAILLKLTDADGVVGWGEANALQPFTDESSHDVAAVLGDELLPMVLKDTAPEPARIDRILDGVRPGRHLIAKGAVTMALLDIQGKRLKVPVAELLGGAIRRSLPVSWPLSIGSAEDDIAVIDEKVKQGFFHFTLKMGTAPIADELKRVAALDAHYGDAVKFRADANAGWSRQQAEAFLDGVQGSRLGFLEQPVAKADIDGMEALAKRTALPISADESLTGMAEAKALAERGAANIFSIKSSKNGGPLRAKGLAELARGHGIKCYFNSMLEGGVTQAASLHHAVTTSNILEIGHAFMSTLRMDGDPTNFSSFVRHGVVYLPEGPGLGIDVSEAQVRRDAVASKLFTTG